MSIENTDDKSCNITTYDDILMEDADKLLSFGNEYESVIAVENDATGTIVNEAARMYDFPGNPNSSYGGRYSNQNNEVEHNGRIRRDAEDTSEDEERTIKSEKKLNNAIKGLTAAAAAVTGGAVTAAATGGGKTAGIVALASAVATAAGAIGQEVHDKVRVKKLKAKSIQTLDDKLDDITIQLNSAGPGEKRDLLVARDALKKAKTSIIKM